MLYSDEKRYVASFELLDAPPIIKRNGNEFHDYWRIVKYAYFSILFLFLFFFSLFYKYRA